MPLVLTENEETESGITYEDRTGISYQYPRAYRRIIRSGERFVYYKGRRIRGGGRRPQVYFGTGLVGNTRPDPRRQGHFVCEILDYRPFDHTVPFKDAAAKHFEPGGARRGYFQRGVRVVSEDAFHRILDAAQTTATVPSIEKAIQVGIQEQPWAHAYASGETIKAVEDFAVSVALKEARRRYPEATVEAQPRTNPGFDLLVSDSQRRLYIEVKGTQRASPLFCLTQGELTFAKLHSQDFRLIVVYNIDLEAGSFQVLWHEGAISRAAGFQMKPLQWVCRILGGSS